MKRGGGGRSNRARGGEEDRPVSLSFHHVPTAFVRCGYYLCVSDVDTFYVSQMWVLIMCVRCGYYLS